VNDLTKRAWSGLLSLLLAIGALMFLPAWSLAFWQGWVYWLVFSGSVLLITIYFLRHDPSLIERRLQAGPAAEKQRSQRVIQLVASIAFCALFVVAGLDHRFSWSRVPVALVGAGDALAGLGFLVVFLVFKENTYTSSIIEVAGDQTVISTGPYGLVRHPMYAGALLLLLMTPLALGSWWALVPVIPLGVAIVWRLLDEERFLIRSLPGYKAYLEKVSRRLMPGVW